MLINALHDTGEPGLDGLRGLNALERAGDARGERAAGVGTGVPTVAPSS